MPTEPAIPALPVPPAAAAPQAMNSSLLPSGVFASMAMALPVTVESEST